MSKARAPMAPPLPFVWTRRIVLTLLTVFAVVPLYVMVSSSVKPLQDVTGTFRWIPARSRVEAKYWAVVMPADAIPETLEWP